MPQPFERARPILENCLVTQYRQAERGGSYPKWLLAGAVLLLAVGVWVTLRVLERQRWERYVDRLNDEPGLMVVGSVRRDGKFHVTGLRDPLVKNDPAKLAADMGIPGDTFDGRWETYQTLESSFVIARATNLLRPPAGVTLTFSSDSGTLTASGVAPERWIVDSERLGPAVAGVRRFVYDGPERAARLKAEIEAASVLFPKGQSTLLPSQEAALTHVLDLVQEFDDTLRVRGLHANIQILGHTDTDGSDSLNGPLSNARANVAREALLRLRLTAIEIEGHGVGSTAPVGDGASEPEKERNRRASFHVQISERASGSARP